MTVSIDYVPPRRQIPQSKKALWRGKNPVPERAGISDLAVGFSPQINIQRAAEQQYQVHAKTHSRKCANSLPRTVCANAGLMTRSTQAFPLRAHC